MFKDFGAQTKAANWRPWNMPAIKADKEDLALETALPCAEHEDDELIERQKAEQLAHDEHLAYCENERLKAYDVGFKQGHEEGLKRGFDEGYRDGLKKAQEDAQPVLEQQINKLDEVAQNWSKQLVSLGEDIGQNMIALSLRIAAQIVRKEYKQAPDWVTELVTEILLEHKPSDFLTFYVAPDDYDLIHAHLVKQNGSRQWNLVRDSTIERGGCKVNSPYGLIDATVESRLSQAAQKLGVDQ